MKFGDWNILFILTLVQASQQFTDDDLSYVTSVHGAFCGKEHLCAKTQIQEDANLTAVDGLYDLPVPLPDYINPNCCKPCSCDINTCLDFGDCCPDVLVTLQTMEESKKPTRAACQRMTLKGVGDTFRVYHRCAESYTVEDNDTAEIKSKCEQSKNYFDFDTKLPVVDSKSRRTYANRYCAMCGLVPVTNLIKWSPRLFCENGAVFTQSSNINSIVKDIQNTEHCDIQFLWPEEIAYEPLKCRRVRSQCNTTGKWKDYNPVIEAACFSYRSIFSYFWKNVFCFLCNERQLYTEYCKTRVLEGFTAVSFAAVLQFADEPVKLEESTGPSNCSSAQVFDHFKVSTHPNTVTLLDFPREKYNICRDLSCSFPRLVQEGQCVNVGDKVIGLAYRLHLRLKLLEVQHSLRLEDLASMVGIYGQSELIKKWDNLLALANFTLFYKLIKEEHGPTSDTVLSSTTDSSHATFTREQPLTPTDTSNQQETDVEHNSTLNSDTVNTFGISSLLSDPSPTTPASVVEYFLFQIEWNFLDAVSKPHSADFIDTILNLDGKNITLQDPKSESSVHFFLSIHEYRRNNHNYPIDPTTNISLVIYPQDVRLPEGRVLNENMPNIKPLTPALICPMVEINEDEYNITENDDGIFIEQLAETFNREIVKIKIGDNNTVYCICKSNYLSVTERYADSSTTPYPKHANVEPQGTLSVVCACISILFCLLTFLTYALFSTLRTQPGVNNMLLCICLVCAQTLFTFAAPQSDYVTKSICALLGGLVHFFWLMVIFAMNVCSYHMFIVFFQKSSHENKTGSRPVRTTLYIVFCVLASLLFVTINIIVDVFGSETAGIGYGEGGMCYISRRAMIGYTFALPVGVVILVNLTFFIIVVGKISSLPSINSSTMKDRNFFSIYAKLSILTGFTWIFGYLFEFTKQAVFEYLFIILNGGIGVLIFISFVCNARTYNLFKGKFLMSSKSTGTKEVEL